MKRLVDPPYICLITRGETNPANFDVEKKSILDTVRDAVDDGVNLVQIREKALPGRLLFDLAKEVIGTLKQTNAVVLINERSDVALEAGAHGVHLPETSLPPSVVRHAFGNELVIGVSTHSVEAAINASQSGADYLFFGPVFETPGKGAPAGLGELRRVRESIGSFPAIALGGIDETNTEQVFATGVAGIAAIRRSMNENLAALYAKRRRRSKPHSANIEIVMTQPVCLTIAGLDPSGGAGILADVRTFAAFGCFPAAAVTSITFQNTVGVFGAEHQSADAVRRQVEPIIEDYTIAALKTGMLPTREVIEETARLIQGISSAKLVVDPVVRSTSGFDLIDDDALRSLIAALFPLADVVTPNLPEAERIAGFKIASIDDIDKAAAAMQSMGAKNVLIKGGHLDELNIDERQATDYLYEGAARNLFSTDHIDSTATHGTGCTLAAAITANLALGKTLADAVAISKQFVTNAIRTAPMLGHGHSPINIS